MTDLLVTPEAFADFRGKTFDDTDFASVKALEVASDFVRAKTAQHFTPVENDEVELQGNWTRRLWLPQRPVTALGAVSIRRYGWTTFQTMTGLTVNRRGLVLAYGWDWGGPEATIRAIYSHGSTTLPDGIEGIVLAIAARRRDNPAGTVNSETLSRYAYTTAVGSDGAPLYVTEQELKDLAEIRNVNLEQAA
jgi:hypothetical protein